MIPNCVEQSRMRLFNRPTGVTKTPNLTHERQFAAFWQTRVNKLIRYDTFAYLKLQE